MLGFLLGREMAVPRVFISSTCYDLKHIRESLKYFVRSIGYDPVLSDDGDVYYSHLSHTHDSCVSEVGSCQIFVLIIGGRYGGAFSGSTKSITNHEYLEAVSCGIPVFTLVDASVYSEHNVYNRNKKKDSRVDSEDICYPSVDNTKIFSFVDEVRGASRNNAIHPFKNYSDIEYYLKKQWAGMMFDFLRRSSVGQELAETRRLMSSLGAATKKTEELLKLLAASPAISVPGVDVRTVISRVEAESFVLSLGSIFRLSDPVDIDPVDFDIDAMPDDWMDFLLLIPGFRVEDWEFNEDSGRFVKVLMGPGDVGIGVGEEALSGEFYPERSSDVEALNAGYDSFYRASAEVKRHVLSRMASGHWFD